MTPEQKATTLKQYDVRVIRLRDQLDWYEKKNPLYTNVEENTDWESSIPTRVVVSRSDIADTEQLASMNGVAASGSATGSYGSPYSEISHEASTHNGAIADVQSSEVATEALAGDRPSSNSLFPRSKNHQKTFQSEIGSDSAATNFDLPDNTILRSIFQDGLNDLDRLTCRHNAPAPAHQNVEGFDEIHEQASVGWISNFSHVDVPTGIQPALDKSRVIVYRSSSILSDFDPAFWVNAFSELFPYGRGGLDEPRTVPIGVHEFIRYCLRLSSRRHAQHRSFAMVSFDVIARHNSLQAVSIKGENITFKHGSNSKCIAGRSPDIHSVSARSTKGSQPSIATSRCTRYQLSCAGIIR
ncbi:unnamed protein product [Phytophthora fragariaefolia]|uniref:Unnamed protein product n=1 Tax=Phytophthora fragariaefolia TaxID=1490495 RepID=A0A9W6XJ97_9STRA|nr:unnamed protein product [Phytophthora fragariaefolia]